MGIYGLLHIMKSVVPGGYAPVRLAEIAAKYRNEIKKDPVILIDTSCCTAFFAAASVGDLKYLKENLETFVNNCFKIGIRLIFVGEGLKSSDRYALWNSKYLCQSSTSVEPKNFFFGLHLSVVPQILQSVHLIQKCEFVRALFHTDQYITEYAKTWGCLAILSNNSKYLIVEGAAYFLSISDLEVHSLTTRNFSRNMLAKYLNISPSELLVFGSLMSPSDPQRYQRQKKTQTGIKNKNEKRNYYKPPEDPQQDENQNKKQTGVKNKNEKRNYFKPQVEEFFKVAELIQTFPKAEEILRDKSLVEAVEGLSEEKRLMFKKQFESFTASGPSEDITPTGFENWDRILCRAKERHVKGVADRKILQMLVNRVVFLMPKRFSHEVTTEFLLPLRKNIYGIIFFECPDTNLAVMEYTNPDGVPVLFYRRAHCGLLQLWSETDSDEILYIKRKVFCQALSEKLTPEALEELDVREEFLFPVVAISYWLTNIKRRPTSFELEILLQQTVLARDISTAELANFPESLPDIMLSDLLDTYLTIVEHLILLNSTCGEPFCRFKTSPLNFFNAKIYSFLYERLKQEPLTSGRRSNAQGQVTVLREALTKLLSVYDGDCKNGGSDAVEVAVQNIKKLNI